MSLRKRLLFIPASLLGAAILVLAIKTRPSPELNPAASQERVVEVLALSRQPMAPLATGFGRVTPKLEWQSIAEVSGRVVYKSSLLERGRVVPAGSLLVRIDPLDYQLVLAQAEADLRSAQAQLNKLDQQESSLRSQLQIEQQRLSISRQELARKQDLRERGLISQSEVDIEQQAALASQRTVEDLENQLFVLPDERKVSEAQVNVNESRVNEAQRSLARTEIYLPFDARIAEVDVEQDQVVNLQQVMLRAHGLDVVEIDAQIALHDYSNLVASFSPEQLTDPDRLELGATVFLNSGERRYSWPASVSRISDSVSLNQATTGIIVDVELPTQQLNPERQPTLVNGMFVEVQFEGMAQPHWLVPESALHGERIYLMEEGLLKVVAVEVLFRRDGMAAVASVEPAELYEGALLVLTDLLPAVEGMALRALDADSPESDSAAPAEEQAQ
ncbi:efflux RND transporter periplasmic adaptor subunit [Aliagarivorans taiwanensis]|uniref:efflux RND transporter periplasmic adaptor subunit n=1 Tax=Aliagarivorans taiwanensis TaxID=561966 RepID=UPI000429A285|nr:biotin/lipoyl-binding protein [Aliagarivorans taiwanensis]